MSLEKPESTNPDSFNPLAGTPGDPTLQSLLAKSIALNIVNSYHNKFDAIVEGVQNAVDAIEARWANWDGTNPTDAQASPDERPQIRVNVNAGTNRVEIIDNGVGLPRSQYQDALIPNVSLKKSGELGTRGHKGVGTTFLAYGHNLFEFHTKHARLEASESAYRLTGGLNWARSEDLVPPPSFQAVPIDERLRDFFSGSLLRLEFGEGTTYGNIGSTFYNKPALWAVILRTFTAIGYLRFGGGSDDLPMWARDLKITLELTGAASSGTVQVPFLFALPHEAVQPARVRELQWLQNNPGTNREFDMIYVSRNHAELRLLLGDGLAELRNAPEEAERAIADQFDQYEIAAYASLSYKNVYYEDLFREAIATPDARSYAYMNVSGGVQIASTSMPVGSVLDHLDAKMKPEYKRRLYLVIHFNRIYAPDIGRKTIPRSLGGLVQWLESQLLTLLVSQSTRLLRSADESSHSSASFAQAQEQLRIVEAQLAGYPRSGRPLSVLPLDRAPRYEQEVVATFMALLASRQVTGYEFVGIPGAGTRYDALFNFTADAAAAHVSGAPVPLGIASSQFVAGKFSRTSQWLEFKVDLEELLEEFELADGDPNKKYFAQISLAVVWRADPASLGRYAVVPIDAKNWVHRNFAGSSHFVETEGQDHRIEVIELSSVIDRLGAQTTT